MRYSVPYMNAQEILRRLEEHGSEQTRTIYRRHGARDPLFGVKIADLKAIHKENRNKQTLAEDLWRSGNSDAMYLASLIADSETVSRSCLEDWMREAYWYMLSEVAVAGLAAESPYGWELGNTWINDAEEMTASGGWATLATCTSILPDERLPVDEIRSHLTRITETIHDERNRVRYSMNNYIICVGSYVRPLHADAIAVAQKVGEVAVNMGKTACKTPHALRYIHMMAEKGRIGTKRKYARC